jgi:hypothetical protein
MAASVARSSVESINAPHLVVPLSDNLAIVPSKRSLRANSETRIVPRKNFPEEKKYRALTELPKAPIKVSQFAVIPIFSKNLQLGVIKAVTGALNRF